MKPDPYAPVLAPGTALIDSHCHLDARAWDDDAGVDGVVARAHQAGVTHMVAIGSGYGFESANRAHAVASRHDRVVCSVGLHPHDASEYTEGRLADMLALRGPAGTVNTRAGRVVALGEMGLDYHYDYSPRDLQRAAFRAQLAAARELELPVIIHDRDSDGETLTILDDMRAFDTGVLFHCYTGDVGYMEAITGRGGYISIPGIVTFKNGDVMREVAARTPLDRLLIETDSPFLTPVPFRGRKNEPAFVGLVAVKVAEVRGMTPEAVAEAAAGNTRRYFGF
ncbi:MAG: TatD family deoxyribonuclease [Myxococcales bacterium]|nr:TatD family deoxyribonuclease [Myxococcales bacterium]